MASRNIFNQWEVERLVLKLAKDELDPLYYKYLHYKKLKDRIKKQLLRKYGDQAIKTIRSKNPNFPIQEPWWD